MTARIENIVTRGVFSLDGQDFDVDNNVYIVGDDNEVVVIDAAHDASAIEAAVDGRNVVAVICTHGHNDHISVAPEFANASGASIHLHPDDQMLWEVVHPDVTTVALVDGQTISVAGTEFTVFHTPGHSPGGVCLYSSELGTVFSGDTLFHGGPGATGRSFSHFPTILDSIRERLLSLPDETRVLTGHGDETTIGTEAASYDEWVARGH